MNETELRSEIAAERRELAELLGDLPAGEWDAPSLCEGWRIREVAAHITMAYRYSAPRVIFELVRSGGSFDRMLDRCARRDAASIPADDLHASLRDNTTHPWKPPGGGYAGALTHDVVHGLDMTIALGLERRVPERRLRVVLEGLASPKGLKYFGADLDGIELRADDMDWSFGSGAPVTGAAQDLAMVLCGRRLPAGRLSGEQSARFAAV
ncbi:maleylpyruvate isomerase family mycothiol-dependent enzyme [Actinomadura rudentiformis]|uniref:Maleylpyruvate isomerase family mycothiol-dependent enzyme n=1 Tax=Actinomadura rudentiformis TaxID=359158 RepID=A0A6H9Y5T1_9ACTN|nr:maleylpyruvate isomerase family mycothiol-dependent enzyme [Actinomadura rudentiformis]KAB2339441.1 maleylpyruvate isomerase family mycothiol-dependent enzyme [Actinomadura rudentiformis]